MALDYNYFGAGGLNLPDLSDATNNTSRYHDDWSEDIFNRDITKSTFYAYLSTLNWKPAKSPRIIWDEETLMPLTDVNGSTVPAATGAMDVDNVERWVTGTVARNTRTAEQVIVTEVDTANNQVTLGYRGVGESVSSAQTINDNDTWQLLIPSREERSRSHESTMHSRSNYWNYLSIFSETLDMSETMRSYSAIHGKSNFSEWDHQMALTEERFRRKMLSAFFLQDRGYPTVTNNTLPIFGGARTYLTNGTVNANLSGSPMSKSFFRNWVTNWRTISKSTHGVMVMPTSITQQFNSMYENQIIFNDKLPEEIKLHVKTINLGGIMIDIHGEDVLDDVGDNTIYLFDASNKDKICMRYAPCRAGKKVANGKPTWAFDQQDNDDSIAKAQIIARCCPQIIGGSTGNHALCTNVGD